MRASDPARPWMTPLAMIGCALFALPLVGHAYAGTADRYLGDDYCAGYIFRDYGLFGGQVWYYKAWSAVPTTLLLMALTEPGGSRLAPFLPALAIAFWVIAASWAIRKISTAARLRWPPLVCVCLAEALIFATLQDAPNVAQSLYLRVPMLAYTCPLIVLTIYAGWLASKAHGDTATATALLVSAAFAFFFGAFGPVCATFLIAAAVLAWGVTRISRGEAQRDGFRGLERLLAAGFAGGVIALAVVALAPGNAGRQVRFPVPPNLFKVAVWSVLYTAFMFCRPLIPFIKDGIVAVVPGVLGGTPRWLPTALDMAISPVPLLTAILMPAGLSLLSVPASGSRQFHRRALWGIPLLAFTLVCACMAPGAYGTSAPPPPRALLIPQYVITCLAAAWGYSLGAVVFAARRDWPGLRPAFMAVAASLLLLAGPVAAMPPIVRTGTAMREWARRWDGIDLELRKAHAAGVRDATVPSLEALAGVGSISVDPHDWVNVCAANYYGLATITGIPAR